MEVYFDNSATTKVFDCVRDIVVKGLRFLLPPPEPESCSCGDSQCYQVYAAAQAVDEGACPCIPQVL